MKGVRKQRETSILKKEYLRKLNTDELRTLHQRFIDSSNQYKGTQGQYKQLSKAHKVYSVLQEKAVIEDLKYKVINTTNINNEKLDILFYNESYKEDKLK